MPPDYERLVIDALVVFARRRTPAPVSAAAVAAEAHISEQMAEITLRRLRTYRAVRQIRRHGRPGWELAQ